MGSAVDPKWSLRAKSDTVLCFTPDVEEPPMLCSSPDSASGLHLLANTAINLCFKELGLFQNHAPMSKTPSTTTTGVPKRRRSGRKKRTVFPRDVFYVAEMEENRGLKRHQFETECFSFEREEEEVGIGLKRRRTASYGVTDYMKESWTRLVCAF